MADLQRLPLGDVVFRVQQLLVVGEHLQLRREIFRHQEKKTTTSSSSCGSRLELKLDAMRRKSSLVLTPPTSLSAPPTSLSVAQRRQSARRAGAQVLAGKPLYLLP